MRNGERETENGKRYRSSAKTGIAKRETGKAMSRERKSGRVSIVSSLYNSFSWQLTQQSRRAPRECSHGTAGKLVSCLILEMVDGGRAPALGHDPAVLLSLSAFLHRVVSTSPLINGNTVRSASLSSTWPTLENNGFLRYRFGWSWGNARGVWRTPSYTVEHSFWSLMTAVANPDQIWYDLCEKGKRQMDAIRLCQKFLSI